MITPKHVLRGHAFNDDPAEKAVHINGRWVYVGDGARTLVEPMGRDLSVMFMDEFSLDRCLDAPDFRTNWLRDNHDGELPLPRFQEILEHAAPRSTRVHERGRFRRARHDRIAAPQAPKRQYVYGRFSGIADPPEDFPVALW